MPPKPATIQEDFAENLFDCIAKGNIGSMRRAFDQAFWLGMGATARPTFGHLVAALETGDVDKVRLLVTYGAQPSEQNLAALRENSGEKYPAHIQLLRRGGARLSQQALREASDIANRIAREKARAAENARRAAEAEERRIAERQEREAKQKEEAEQARLADIEKIPQEWQKVRTGLALFAGDAVIAGGALRDLDHDRKIKDVDIFLPDQGSKRANRKLIEKAFDAADVKIHKQEIGYSYGPLMKKFSDPKKSKLVRNEGYGLTSVTHTQSWNVMAGDDKTVYNIVFLDGDAVNKNKEIPFGQRLSSLFDLDICMIFFDGNIVNRMPRYKQAVESRTISLCLENEGSQDHIRRVHEKYKDWGLSKSARKLLNQPPPVQTRRPVFTFGS